MINQINNSDNFSSLPSQVELDFLAALLEVEDASYPWNPADEESEAYFCALEQQFLSDDLWEEEELTKRSQNFYRQLDTLWPENPTHSHHKTNISQILFANLQAAFANAVPHSFLDTIAQKASEIFTSQQSLKEQLVTCVQGVLPAWEAEDLFVLARPYAYAMRSGEPQCPKSFISKFENREWTTLSDVEQAKISLAISYYALTQLSSFESES
ncbi:hypothetical protein NIES2100_54180 [Calothrix sp. NIES-2100]|uniref:hypothetical protein n=1 Tax=Calothrix sp. NIES-2100 TaxID=1954172 RepID=UPI000B60FA43|nr:hypothetical protein NIES2100_54180 [Calothrix sp. NIES-2100]